MGHLPMVPMMVTMQGPLLNWALASALGLGLAFGFGFGLAMVWKKRRRTGRRRRTRRMTTPYWILRDCVGDRVSKPFGNGNIFVLSCCKVLEI